jgi:hypothetical protein
VLSRQAHSFIQLALLALWLGAAGFFSAAVAPALFAVLPARALAGAVVARLLPVILYSGMAIGVVVGALQVSKRGEWAWQTPEIGAAAIVAACAVAQFYIGARIERLRAEIGGAIDGLAATDARRLAFGRLHGASVAWLGVAILAALVVGVVVTNDAINKP